MSYAAPEDSIFADSTSQGQLAAPLVNYPSSGVKAGDPVLHSSVLVGSSESKPPQERNTPSTADLQTQWGLQHIRAFPSSWNAAEKSPVLVAVLDTGIDKEHEDLFGRVVAEIDLSNSPSSADYYGHGTAIAGIIAADADNGLGIAGLAPASLLVNVKVADDDGSCQLSALAAGIIWAVDYGAEVINISIEIKRRRSGARKGYRLCLGKRGSGYHRRQ